MHITSLPGPYGIGDLGREAKEFIDDLVLMRQTLWQILPTNPPESDNCPYNSNSAFANNPLMISPDLLIEEGFINHDDLGNLPNQDDQRVDFNSVIKWKIPILEKAARRFLSNAPKEALNEYKLFCSENKNWIDNYALFCVIQNIHDEPMWENWESGYKNLDQDQFSDIENFHSHEIEIIKVLQFLFYRQWVQLKDYANTKGIKIIGDIPIYISYNSADVWSNKNLFKLSVKGKMIVQSGCPPDFFVETGQTWGHPIYDWTKHQETGYSWWLERISHLLKYVDIIRIDHFNGFAKYWEVPAEDKNGLNGKWVLGPQNDFIGTIYEKLGDVKLMAEDLGEASKDAAVIRNEFDIPGMQILQHSFAVNNPLKTIPENMVVYTGTHDNDTSVGWFKNLLMNKKKQVKNQYKKELYHAKESLQINKNEIQWAMIKYCLESKAMTVIFPLQDILGLSSEARMNTPGTTDNGNWEWRLNSQLLTNKIKNKVKFLTIESER